MRINGGDPFDPNNWIPDDHEYRIYACIDYGGGDMRADPDLYVVVSKEDYSDLVRYRWNLHDRKKYERLGYIQLKRCTTEYLAPEGPRYISPTTGKLTRNYKRIQRSVFIHQEIMERTGIPRPSPKHKEVDHYPDRKTKNCRRENLRWATRGMQVSGSNLGRANDNGKPSRNVRKGRPNGPS
jgi:hypothetical protein